MYKKTIWEKRISLQQIFILIYNLHFTLDMKRIQHLVTLYFVVFFFFDAKHEITET